MAEKSKKDLLPRLKKIEGQVRGVQRMIEEDRYCVDILMQIAAIKAGITKIGIAILEGHTRGCVIKAIQEGKGDESVDELMDILTKFVK